MDTLAEVQRLLISEFGLDPTQTAPDAELAGLGIDSLATLEFLFKLEEVFGVELREGATPIRTVGDIATEIDRVLASTRPSRHRDSSACG